MKRLATILGLSALAVVVTATGVLAAHRLTTPTPIQGSQLAVVVNGDTVTGSGNATSGPNATCAQTNFFKVGGNIVFRVWGTDVPGGGYSLTPTNVASAVVNIPGEKSQALNWVSEPRNAPKISYWETFWTVPKGYPLGTVNFNVVIKTKKTTVYPSFTGKWSQQGFASNSQLQIIT